MKIKLTEGQVERLRAQMNEETNSRYNREVKLTFMIFNSTYKGFDVDGVAPVSARVTFSIDIEARSWGIKGISLGNIKGPSEIETEIEFYDNEENLHREQITLALDWDKISVNQEKGKGIVSIGDEIDIELMNDEQGNLIVKQIEVYTYEL